MTSRFLITTADERTWRRDRPVLFLGEWCRLYPRRALWETLDADVVPYHWDDREKYYQDYCYLQAVYEDLLRRIGTVLDGFHGIDHSMRYWRILVGPWLYSFIHVLFDRWTMIRRAADFCKISETEILDFPIADMIPADFKALNPDSIEWNHYILGRAIKWQKTIPWVEIPLSGKYRAEPQERRPIGKHLLAAAHALASSSLGVFTRCDESLIISSYLPRLDEIKLQIALGQVPKLWRVPSLVAFTPDLSKRQQLRIAGVGDDDYCQFLCSMIPEQIPTVYLEGYRNLTRMSERLPWPSRPKVIFTSNLFQFCEVFQAWAAAKVERGFPLVIGQHGGVYGVGKCVAGEDHQVKISDRYLTWGWQDERPATFPSLVFTIVNKPKDTWSPDGSLILVTAPVRVISFKNGSWPVGPNQSESFVSNQLRFASILTEQIRASLTVRIHRHIDRKTMAFYADRWKDTYPNINIDYSTEPLEGLLCQCRLFVYTYNSTGFLETLARNIPTIIFWDPAYFELRTDAQPYFERLKQAGIFHETPESAAAKVVEVWEDVTGWWARPEIQDARRYFCDRFARMPKQPIRVLKEALTSVRPARQG